jgi:tRNA-dihydrouridine synthase
MFEATGCSGISIGRGAFYNPWLFRHVAHYLKTGQVLPEPALDERLDVMRRHLDRMIEVFGEEQGCRKFRKVALQYARRFGPAKEFDRRVVRLNSRAEFEEIVEHYRRWRTKVLDVHGDLLPHYRPRPLFEKRVDVPAGRSELS